MNWLMIESWSVLLLLEGMMRFRGLSKLHEMVRKQQVKPSTGRASPSAQEVLPCLGPRVRFLFQAGLVSTAFCSHNPAPEAPWLSRDARDRRAGSPLQVSCVG